MKLFSIYRFVIIYLLSVLFIYCPNSYSQSAVGGLSAEQIYNKVSDAVVVVHAYDDNNKLAAQGSGVVLDDKGYVVTNYHVLSGNERLEILHGKEIVPYVDIIGIDVEKDILILKIGAKKFPSIKLGNSKSLKIGQRVYAIGSPMGFENTISEGIISGLRSYDKLKRNFIQITASISPGSSGGAVVNEKGELIGISTLTAKEGQNLNFAIPIDDALSVKIGSFKKNDEYKDFELFEKGYNADTRGDYHEAIKYYSRFIEKYPNNANAYNNRGVVKRELEDYIGAIQDYNKAIAINPNDADPYNNRGIVKSKTNDHTGALEDFNKAIEFRPFDAKFYFNRGITKIVLEDSRSAIQDWNKAIDINPNYAEAYYNRGLAKINLKDYKGAIQDFNKAIAINPNDAEVYTNLGYAKSKLKDYTGAIQDYNKVIEINPNDATAFYNRGNTKVNLKDYTGAIQDFNKAIELNPILGVAYINRGIAKRNLENFRGAIQDYNKVIDINPNYAEAYFNRGNAKYDLGDKAGACLDWSKAGELGDATAYELIKQFCK